MIPSPRIAALLLLLAWPLQPLDDAVRARVQHARTPALEAPMRIISGRSRAALIVGGVVALAAGAAGRGFVGEAVVALVPVNALVEGLKWTVWRTRPDGDTHRKNSSFPSSHAANAFAVAAIVTRRWRRWAIPAWLLASLVAYSRLYLDRHWLSDVLGGLAIAMACAWLAARLLEWWSARAVTRAV